MIITHTQTDVPSVLPQKHSGHTDTHTVVIKSVMLWSGISPACQLVSNLCLVKLIQHYLSHIRISTKYSTSTSCKRVVSSQYVYTALSWHTHTLELTPRVTVKFDVVAFGKHSLQVYSYKGTAVDYKYQIKMYSSHALNTTGIDLTVKCLLTSPSQRCRVK
jgi:hypothetical protein